jgi:hemerythrin HHE cation binding domain-containing protein
MNAPTAHKRSGRSVSEENYMARKKQGRQGQARRRRNMARTGAKRSSAATSARRTRSLGPAAKALAEDHRRIEALFGSFVASADEAEKQKLVEEICAALIVHTAIEEEIFYPACREALPQDQIMDTAQVEHDGTKILIADLLEGDGDDPYRDAKVEVLAVQVGHHVGEEEKSKDGIFAQAAKHGVDTDDLATRLLERKQALQRRAAELRPTRAISLQPTPEMEDTMARSPSNERERDERGRFVSDDDDDDRRSSRRSRSREDDDDDDRGGRGRGRGGWFGDSEGHSRAARQRRDDDDDRGGRSRSRSRDDDGDDDRGGRGRSRGGWFGDSEGHSEASRRGWERSDHEGSGWYGDRRGHSEASRRGWERSDHEGSGWYGDSEGHAEAARRRWDDDDRRGRRSRGRD